MSTIIQGLFFVNYKTEHKYHVEVKHAPSSRNNFEKRKTMLEDLHSSFENLLQSFSDQKVKW